MGVLRGSRFRQHYIIAAHRLAKRIGAQPGALPNPNGQPPRQVRDGERGDAIAAIGCREFAPWPTSRIPHHLCCRADIAYPRLWTACESARARAGPEAEIRCGYPRHMWYLSRIEGTVTVDRQLRSVTRQPANRNSPKGKKPDFTHKRLPYCLPVLSPDSAFQSIGCSSSEMLP